MRDVPDCRDWQGVLAGYALFGCGTLGIHGPRVTSLDGGCDARDDRASEDGVVSEAVLVGALANALEQELLLA